jgi:hypothetical protein
MSEPAGSWKTRFPGNLASPNAALGERAIRCRQAGLLRRHP